MSCLQKNEHVVCFSTLHVQYNLVIKVDLRTEKTFVHFQYFLTKHQQNI